MHIFLTSCCIKKIKNIFLNKCLSKSSNKDNIAAVYETVECKFGVVHSNFDGRMEPLGTFYVEILNSKCIKFEINPTFSKKFFVSDKARF